MTLAEACLLASEIEAEFMGWDVVAIGRFVPPEDITPRLPWKVCVTTGDERPVVLDSRADALSIRFRQRSGAPQTTNEGATPQGMLF